MPASVSIRKLMVLVGSACRQSRAMLARRL